MGLDMKVVGPARLDLELDAFLKQTQAALEVILDDSLLSVEATWSARRDDDGRGVIGLTLGDRSDGLKVSGELFPDDFKGDDRLSRRLRELWGDFLLARLKAIGGRLKAILSEEGVAL